MSILLPALLWFGSGGSFTFGGAKPVPVNSRKFRNYKRGDILVSAAGVVTNIILAILWAVVFVLLGLLGHTFPSANALLDIAQRMVVYGIWINLILCFFNLIPIPPLDGSHLFYHILPAELGSKYRGLQRFGYLPIFILMFVFRPVISFMLTPAYMGMSFLLQLILPFRVGQAWNIFQS
jgi:Zn-dependent protease